MSRQKQRPFRCCSRQKHRDIMTAMIKNNDILTVDERLKLLKSLRWWHLGYGFIWSTVFVGASTTGTGSDLDSVYQVLQLLGCILAVIITAFVSRHTFSSSPRCAWVCGFALSFGALAFYLPSILHIEAPISIIVQLLGGIIVGSASGYAYCLWQQFFVSEGEGTTGLFIPLSGFLSIFLCSFLGILPTCIKAIFAIAPLPCLSAISLYKSLSEITPHDPEEMKESTATLFSKHDALNIGAAVICCCIINFTWEISAGVLDISSDLSFWAMIAGQGLSVIAASVSIFLLGSSLNPAQSFRNVYPIAITALCLVLINQESFSCFSIGALVFVSEIMNMLLLYSVSVYCASRKIPPLPMYAFSMVPLYLSMLIGRIASVIWPNLSEATSQSALVLSLFLIALSILATYKPFQQDQSPCISTKRSEEAGDSEEIKTPFRKTATKKALEPKEFETPSSDTVPDDSSSVQQEVGMSPSFLEPLTPREIEVLNLISMGNTVAATSRKLFISENTTRSHIKTIYRKAGVHSRQELIDKLDGK